jgi:hypothetical protein
LFNALLYGRTEPYFYAFDCLWLNGLASLASAPYGTEPPSWIKIKNPAYTQAVGRRERLENMRARKANAT